MVNEPTAEQWKEWTGPDVLAAMHRQLDESFGQLVADVEDGIDVQLVAICHVPGSMGVTSLIDGFEGEPTSTAVAHLLLEVLTHIANGDKPNLERDEPAHPR